MISAKIDNVEWVENPDADSQFFGEIVDANWETDAWHVHKDDFKLWMETLDDFVLYGAVEKARHKLLKYASLLQILKRPSHVYSSSPVEIGTRTNRVTSLADRWCSGPSRGKSLHVYRISLDAGHSQVIGALSGRVGSEFQQMVDVLRLGFESITVDKFNLHIGFYYTRPEYRNLGIGKCLFDKVAKHMNGYNVGLAAAIKMSPVYANCYGMNKILDDPFWIYKIECKEAVLPKPHSSFKTCELTDENSSALVSYDKTIAQNIERSQQILGWTQSSIATTRVAYDTTGKAVGICCIRKIRNALAIAPLYADSLEVAQTLLHDTVSSIENWRPFSYFHAMGPESCKDAGRLFDDLNNGNASGRVADYIQFTDHLPTGYCYRKVYGIMECSTSVV